ncbi:hypothetical protein AB5N19_10552 [Seiridium cardinale]|uniref:Uncharacterized protein n=1 Tax=Seiridium cardinale TaxID=138064 RepID=A0ABR2XH50_9PEZI
MTIRPARAHDAQGFTPILAGLAAGSPLRALSAEAAKMKTGARVDLSKANKDTQIGTPTPSDRGVRETELKKGFIPLGRGRRDHTLLLTMAARRFGFFGLAFRAGFFSPSHSADAAFLQE